MGWGRAALGVVEGRGWDLLASWDAASLQRAESAESQESPGTAWQRLGAARHGTARLGPSLAPGPAPRPRPRPGAIGAWTRTSSTAHGLGVS